MHLEIEHINWMLYYRILGSLHLQISLYENWIRQCPLQFYLLSDWSNLGRFEQFPFLLASVNGYLPPSWCYRCHLRKSLANFEWSFFCYVINVIGKFYIGFHLLDFCYILVILFAIFMNIEISIYKFRKLSIC